MSKFRCRSFGKINLSLDITGKRSDGYHDVVMVMLSVPIYDEIFINKKSEGIRVICDKEDIPTDKRNLAYKAAELMKERYGIDEGVEITIKKNIPVSAGMAGGSSDAAAVLKGMNEIFDLNLETKELALTGLLLGADVPFCLYGGTALAEGIGEKLTFLSRIPECYIAIAKPEFGVSTKWAYDEYDKTKVKKHPRTKEMLKAIDKGDLKQIANNMYNVLEEIATKKYEEIGDIKDLMLEEGALGSMMTGSGPTVFGIFDDKKKAERAVYLIEEKQLTNQSYVLELTKEGE